MKSCCSNHEETFSAILSEISQNSGQLAIFITIVVFLILWILWSRRNHSKNTEKTESGKPKHPKMD